ncbi:MAG: alpha/beta fold hydrolase [Pseudonocardiales bacterium]
MTNYVLVHGAFIGGWYWRDVAELLKKEGHRVEVVEQLPSIGTDPTALGDLHTDAAVVRQVIDAVGDQVTLVGHSYGGMVVTELADHPAVAHSVYLSALWPLRGQSCMDLFGGSPPPWVVLRDDGTVEASDDLEVMRQVWCADVDPQRATENIRRKLPMSISSIVAASTAPARGHPTTYIILENDQTIPPAAQQQMSAAADHVVRLVSSHQAMVSIPDKLAAVLANVK